MRHPPRWSGTGSGVAYSAPIPRSWDPAEVSITARQDIDEHGCGRGGFCLRAVARLAPGVGLEEARADADRIARELEVEHPSTNGNLGFTLTRLRDDMVGDQRAGLLALFAAVGLVLAAVGLYGVVSYAVGLRRREIGVRLALGAAGPQIRTMVLRSTLGMVTIGVATGAVGAFLLARRMNALLFEVGPTDPGTYVVVILVLAAVGLAAGAVPAARASRLDPVQVLKSD